MVPKDIEKLLIKFLHRSANASELDILNDWIKDPKNQLIFKDYIKTHYAITLAINEPDLSEFKEQLIAEIRKENSFFYRYELKKLYKYAAIALVFLGIGYFYTTGFFNTKSKEDYVINENPITIQLDNGDIQVISEDGATQIMDSLGNIIMQQQGTRLTYNNNTPTKKLQYNTLMVPYGKRFDIVLSDGTHVFLNSGSSMKYPVQFISDSPRSVFLEGEAFFDVKKDKKNPFVIKAQELEVNVLGTEFNMSAYPEQKNTEIVLVEGSVSLQPSRENIEDVQGYILKPGSKATFDHLQQTISTQKVNTSLYTSWIKGTIIFRNETFANITKKLERQYNITIIINNKELEKESFSASFDVDKETIQEVLHYFNKVYNIEYQVLSDKVIIQ